MWTGHGNLLGSMWLCVPSLSLLFALESSCQERQWVFTDIYTQRQWRSPPMTRMGQHLFLMLSQAPGLELLT